MSAMKPIYATVETLRKLIAAASLRFVGLNGIIVRRVDNVVTIMGPTPRGGAGGAGGVGWVEMQFYELSAASGNTKLNCYALDPDGEPTGDLVEVSVLSYGETAEEFGAINLTQAMPLLHEGDRVWSRPYGEGLLCMIPWFIKFGCTI